MGKSEVRNAVIKGSKRANEHKQVKQSTHTPSSMVTTLYTTQNDYIIFMAELYTYTYYIVYYTVHKHEYVHRLL